MLSQEGYAGEWGLGVGLAELDRPAGGHQDTVEDDLAEDGVGRRGADLPDQMPCFRRSG